MALTLTLSACGPDETPPVVRTSTPADGATDVAYGAQLAITFSAAMDEASLKATVEPALELGVAVWNDAMTVVYAPPGGWLPGTTYTVRITGRDAAGNALRAGTGITFTTEAPRDTSAPATPTHVEATATDSGFSLSWDANSEDDLAGYAVYLGEAQDSLPGAQYVQAPAHEVAVEGLKNGVTYYFAVAAEDRSGNLSAPSSTDSVTPRDNQPPSLLSSEPADGAVDLALVPEIRLTFSEAMDPNSLQLSICETEEPPATATCGIPEVVDLGSPTWSHGDTELRLTSTDAFAAGKTYVLIVIAKDAAGNTIAGRHAFAFALRATPDTVPPAVRDHVSSLGTDTPNATVAFEFTEAMDQNSVENAFLSQPPVSCRWTWQDTTATCTSVAYLKQLTDYEVGLAVGASDTAGNPLVAPYTFRFTTPNFAPRLVDVDPRSGSFGTSATSPIVFTFSEPMRESSLGPSLEVKAAGDDVPGTTSWDGEAMVATFRPSERYGDGVLVTWTLDTALTEAGTGGLHMRADASGSFRTRFGIRSAVR